MKNMKTKQIHFKGKIKFVIILISAVLIISAVIGIVSYQKYQRQRELDTYSAKITEYAMSFSNAEERNEKIKILQDIEEDFKTYSETDSPLDEITQKYSAEIDSM